MTPTEPDLFDKLRAIFLNAGKLDRGTQLQLTLMLQRALERTLDHDPQRELEATQTPVFPPEHPQPSTTGRGNPQPELDPHQEGTR